MKKRSATAGKREDMNEIAFRVVTLSIGDDEPERERSPVSIAAAALSKLGASKGGHARAAKLTKAERSKAAKLAASARWQKKK